MRVQIPYRSIIVDGHSGHISLHGLLVVTEQGFSLHTELRTSLELMGMDKKTI
jgi:hypothetical protein